MGTAEKVHEAIAKNFKGEFDVVSNPEFLREGVAVDDFMKPDRVVIGTSSERARKVMEELYNPFVRQGNPIIFMNERSAELTKYAANSFLATKISFMNEIAQLCERLGCRCGYGADAESEVMNVLANDSCFRELDMAAVAFRKMYRPW